MAARGARFEARQRGFTRYSTGKPCRNGHICERLVSTRVCVECANEIMKRRWASGDTRLRAASKKWRENNKEKQNAKALKWYYDNKDKVKARNSIRAAKWNRDNKERRKQILLKWRMENPDKFAAIRRSVKERRRNAEGKFAPGDILRIKRMQKGKCAYCREKLGNIYHVDHITPLCLGGTNHPSNIQLCCPLDRKSVV